MDAWVGKRRVTIPIKNNDKVVEQTEKVAYVSNSNTQNAAIAANRKYIGSEISEEYCKKKTNKDQISVMLTKRKQIVESIQFLQWTEGKHSLHQLKNQEWINAGILNFLKHIIQFRNVWMRSVVSITDNVPQVWQCNFTELKNQTIWKIK